MPVFPCQRVFWLIEQRFLRYQLLSNVIPFTMLLDKEHPTIRSVAGGVAAVLGAAALAHA